MSSTSSSISPTGVAKLPSVPEYPPCPPLPDVPAVPQSGSLTLSSTNSSSASSIKSNVGRKWSLKLPESFPSNEIVSADDHGNAIVDKSKTPKANDIKVVFESGETRLTCGGQKYRISVCRRKKDSKKPAPDDEEPDVLIEVPKRMDLDGGADLRVSSAALLCAAAVKNLESS
ncbi:MAG: hypothetical protein M1814_002866 [Vezdaea aestivalis]|nr:MAG: hypothetical protein M1814_002866 [Vezdaea aestivalis]